MPKYPFFLVISHPYIVQYYHLHDEIFYFSYKQEGRTMNILEYENYQEKKSHAGAAFPFNIYLCSIPLDFRQVPLHWHDEMEIIYVKKGSGRVTVDFTPYRVSAGSLVFICPGQLHSIEQYEDERMEYENIIFRLDMLISQNPDICNTDFLTPLLERRIDLETHLTKDFPFYTEIVRFLDEADEICMTSPPGYQLFIKSALYGMFFSLFSHFAQKRSSHKDYASFEKIKFIIKYVEHHYGEKIAISDIARESGFSESHFMKYFKHTMGLSFTQYLNDYRLTMASRLLLTSDSSVLSIAEEVGIENPSYFNRIFKRRFGVTPSVYRKEYGSLS